MAACAVIRVGRRRREARGGTGRFRSPRGRIRERQSRLRLQSSTGRFMYCIMRHEDRRDIDEREKRQRSEREEAYSAVLTKKIETARAVASRW